MALDRGADALRPARERVVEVTGRVAARRAVLLDADSASAVAVIGAALAEGAGSARVADVHLAAAARQAGRAVLADAVAADAEPHAGGRAASVAETGGPVL